MKYYCRNLPAYLNDLALGVWPSGKSLKRMLGVVHEKSKCHFRSLDSGVNKTSCDGNVRVQLYMPMS
jgi:hypothetical protein